MLPRGRSDKECLDDFVNADSDSLIIRRVSKSMRIRKRSTGTEIVITFTARVSIMYCGITTAYSYRLQKRRDTTKRASQCHCREGEGNRGEPSRRLMSGVIMHNEIIIYAARKDSSRLTQLWRARVSNWPC